MEPLHRDKRTPGGAVRARAQSASDKLASIPAPDRTNGEAHVFGNFFLFFFLFGKIVSIIRIINGSLFFLFFFFYFVRLASGIGFMKYWRIIN